jgi:hypothetical protein
VVADALVYASAGFHGLVLENTFDRPYLKGDVGPEIVAALAVVGWQTSSAAVAPDTNGAVWVATKRATPATLLSVGDRIVPRLDAPRLLTCIYRDLQGGLWIGGSGLWERKGDGFAPVPLPPVEPGGGGRAAGSTPDRRDERGAQGTPWLGGRDRAGRQ